MLIKLANMAVIYTCLALLIAAPVSAEDWVQRNYEVIGDGSLQLDYPTAWGNKPKYETFDIVTELKFGPYGPREKPLLMIQLQSVLAAEAMTDEDLREISKVEVEKLKPLAFETDIPLNDVHGEHSRGHYFSITDKESKRGEFDYLTMAVIAADKLLIKCYFFSSDGAPELGADAIRMMQSLRYLPPEEDEDQ